MQKRFWAKRKKILFENTTRIKNKHDMINHWAISKVKCKRTAAQEPNESICVPFSAPKTEKANEKKKNLFRKDFFNTKAMSYSAYCYCCVFYSYFLCWYVFCSSKQNTARSGYAFAVRAPRAQIRHSKSKTICLLLLFFFLRWEFEYVELIHSSCSKR